MKPINILIGLGIAAGGIAIVKYIQKKKSIASTMPMNSNASSASNATVVPDQSITIGTNNTGIQMPTPPTPSSQPNTSPTPQQIKVKINGQQKTILSEKL